MADKKTNDSNFADESGENAGQSTTEQYKDTLFKDIFNDKQRFLELYNAISDSPCNNEADVRIYSNHALLAKYHDIAGLINNELVLMCEHQASINPNMPLRILLYFVDVLRTFIVGENIYGSTRVEIPTPVFYVLYNGDAAYDKDVLELSDSFISKGQIFTMNVKVKVVNINPGYKVPALNKSPWLNGYAQLISKIKEYLGAEHTRDKAIELAIEWCIENDIIKQYLQENHERVIKMLNYEITQEQYEAVIKRDGIIEERKRQIIAIYKKLKSNKQVADLLDISEEEVTKTIKDAGIEKATNRS